jgi:AcrR family transcriptional regulator
MTPGPTTHGGTEREPTPAARRMSASERKQQIVRTVVELVGRYGVQGTTTSRIAAAAGVSEKTLYKHFESRRDMLLAALDLVFDRANRLVHFHDEPDPFERLRSIGRCHWATVTSRDEGFVYPLYEFIAAPPETGLRGRLRERQLATVKTIAGIIMEGQESGEIRHDVDAEQVAWELMAVYTSEDVSYLMGVEEFATAGRSQAMLDRILRDLATGERT